MEKKIYHDRLICGVVAVPSSSVMQTSDKKIRLPGNRYFE